MCAMHKELYSVQHAINVLHDVQPAGTCMLTIMQCLVADRYYQQGTCGNHENH